MPTYTRTQTAQALRWTDDLSALDVVEWVSLRDGRAHRASIESPHDQVVVSSRTDGHSYLRRGDWVIESPSPITRPTGSRPRDPLVSFTTCDDETFTREGWTLKESATAPDKHEQLRTLIKLLCSDVSPYGSEVFQRVRDQVNPETQALLLLSVLDAVPQPKPAEELGVQDVIERTAGDVVTAAGGYSVPLFPQLDGSVKVGRSPESEPTADQIARLAAASPDIRPLSIEQAAKQVDYIAAMARTWIINGDEDHGVKLQNLCFAFGFQQTEIERLRVENTNLHARLKDSDDE